MAGDLDPCKDLREAVFDLFRCERHAAQTFGGATTDFHQDEGQDFGVPSFLQGLLQGNGIAHPPDACVTRSLCQGSKIDFRADGGLSSSRLIDLVIEHHVNEIVRPQGGDER